MAVCSHCDREMLEAESCTIAEYDDFADGVTRARIPYGSETRYSDVPERCHDCNATRGGLHHPGCDMEECPRCQHQAISCDCASKEDT